LRPGRSVRGLGPADRRGGHASTHARVRQRIADASARAMTLQIALTAETRWCPR
jgi:hypothetical protein